jgi:hypothetical protein
MEKKKKPPSREETLPENQSLLPDQNQMIDLSGVHSEEDVKAWRGAF